MDLLSGQTYYPILSLKPDLQNIELTSFESQENFNDPSRFCSWYPYKEGFIIKECNDIGNRQIYWHSDSEPTQILSHAKTGDSQSLVFEYQGQLSQFHPNQGHCELKPFEETFYEHCQDHESNPYLTMPNCTFLNSSIYCLATMDSSNHIYEYSSTGVFKQSFYLSLRSIGASKLKSCFLLNNGRDLTFACAEQGSIIFHQIDKVSAN